MATLDDVVAADPQPMGQPERALEVQELYATIAGLPEDFRLVLVAVDVLGLSYREAARALKTREATVTTRLYRARKQVDRAPRGGLRRRRASGAARDGAASASPDGAARGGAAAAGAGCNCAQIVGKGLAQTESCQMEEEHERYANPC